MMSSFFNLGLERTWSLCVSDHDVSNDNQHHHNIDERTVMNLVLRR